MPVLHSIADHSAGFWAVICRFVFLAGPLASQPRTRTQSIIEHSRFRGGRPTSPMHCRPNGRHVIRMADRLADNRPPDGAQCRPFTCCGCCSRSVTLPDGNPGYTKQSEAPRGEGHPVDFFVERCRPICRKSDGRYGNLVGCRIRGKVMLRKRRGPREDDAGFTLIERLIVVVILGALAAVLVFAVNGLSDRGKVSGMPSRQDHDPGRCRGLHR
ncbi:MAG: hypothetical protein QOI21_2154 [Actinomycetota bacterium]|nr:hypothetical protein [Actinomycetota bacterium]